MAVFLGGIILITSCGPRPAEEPPGVGRKAEIGYAACEPVLAALEEFKEANGSYPAALRELVPDYLITVPEVINGEPVMYRPTDDGYTLSFAYVGPGMNICTYSPGPGWRCSGAY
jgi:hypothetical protein